MGSDILEFAAELQCQELHMFVDDETELKAIVAIHSTLLGPSLGGCRCIEYPNTLSAAKDAIRLARGMTYKAAISNLPLGGGKMVVLKPKQIKDKDAFFKKIGYFVNTLNGRYITAVDSGTSVSDMDIISSQTPYVTSTSHGEFSEADPSLLTALGVLRGIEAAVFYKLGKNSLDNIHVTIQGLGHAGFALAKLLHEKNARLTVFDINKDVMEKCVKECGATSVNDFETLIRIPADVFAPCALGGILYDETINLLNVPIVAGCANNQLEDPALHGLSLMNRGILYAPDYVINAGGLIYVAAQFSHITEDEAKHNIDSIYDTLIKIFERADKEQRSTQEIADRMAVEKLMHAKTLKS